MGFNANKDLIPETGHKAAWLFSSNAFLTNYWVIAGILCWVRRLFPIWIEDVEVSCRLLVLSMWGTGTDELTVYCSGGSALSCMNDMKWHKRWKEEDRRRRTKRRTRTSDDVTSHHQISPMLVLASLLFKSSCGAAGSAAHPEAAGWRFSEPH